MKKLILLIVLMHFFYSQAQLIVNVQLPPSGVIQKSQLWNIQVTNTRLNNVSATINMTMIDNQTGEHVLTASTGIISFIPGNTMLNVTELLPIQYNIMSSSYSLDGSPEGFLPPGTFTVCYDFNLTTIEKTSIAQECNTINVEPLSPPQLILPENEKYIDTIDLPLFSWLPPAPLTLFTNLQYDLYLVEVDSGQSATDAIQTNIPILIQQDIMGPSLLYPSSAPALRHGVQYAWKVVAKNNETPVSNSEVWVFSLKNFSEDNIRESGLPYTRLEKNNESGYAICSGKLKFAYINETTDSAWNVMIFDIISNKSIPIPAVLDTASMNSGLNLINIDLANNPHFIDQHIYSLELRNSRNEVWRMKFEYLKPRANEVK